MSETEINYFPQPISDQIWNQKYRFKTDREGYTSDETVVDTWVRISKALADQPHLHNQPDMKLNLEARFYNALDDFKFLPAGRINSGAGTGRNVTLFNCYVMGTIPDSLDGIFDMLKEAALTMQQGGGIGYDFSTLRPAGAPVKGVESFSSGPLTFMDVWDSMCKTIMSAGSRRGAMMATMRCDHPDIMDFVKAKQDPLRLRNFNVSVLCTDEFMEAVANDSNWDLMFDGKVYETIKAKDLWEAILRNTYDYAEPGVIFIDRINKENNLWFLETIAATNPCGEQPLPPYGACLLGSVNLAKHIKSPFTSVAKINYDKLETTVRTSVRMLDSVVDVSKFPLPEQEAEAKFKRRIGLGVTGLADMLFMIGYKYGSQSSISVVDNLMRTIAIWAYDESIKMAEEIGPAPCVAFQDQREQFIESGFMKRMPDFIRQGILNHGIRNSHLLSVAPTGTISMYAGNVSSGGEPIFAPSYQRKVTNDDGTKRTETVYDYAVLKFEEHFGENDNPKATSWWKGFMATAQDLTPEHHILMQAVLQKWVDSSISKTVNLPKNISFEKFKAVYDQAYETGCKGCTTYRPNDVTGSVLSVEPTEKEEQTKEAPTEEYVPLEVYEKDMNQDLRVTSRPHEVQGSTYKCRWGNDSYYVTFNNVVDPDFGWFMPFEIFINSKNVDHAQWTAALTRMVSAVFQRGGDVRFIAEELKQIHDPKGGQWVNGKYCPSLVALIGQKLSEHLDNIGYQCTPGEELVYDTPEYLEAVMDITEDVLGSEEYLSDQCPSCKAYSMIILSGCPTCQECGHSKCG